MRHVYKTALLSTVLLLHSVANSAPKADLWSFWSQSNESATSQLSHQRWQVLLDRYLVADNADGVHRFAYSRVSAPDRQTLAAYIADLAKADPRSLSRKEQKAYWVNLYNALTVDLILEKYPVSSIRKIRYFSSLFGPWDKKLITVADQRLSLNDIEHRILRPIWQDPRIHFAVNCASIGCPNLQPVAFTADNTEGLLEAAAVEFINHPRAFTLVEGQLTLSSIFDWYAEDFGGSEQSVLKYIDSILVEDLSDSLDQSTIIKYEYDWSLNEALE